MHNKKVEHAKRFADFIFKRDKKKGNEKPLNWLHVMNENLQKNKERNRHERITSES